MTIVVFNVTNRRTPFITFASKTTNGHVNHTIPNFDIFPYLSLSHVISCYLNKFVTITIYIHPWKSDKKSDKTQ